MPFSSKTAEDFLIIALDCNNAQEAFNIVVETKAYCHTYKVGLELFFSEGKPFVKALSQQGCRLFLDLKLHDIPTTVERAIESLQDLQIDFLTVHALGGAAMLDAAKRALRVFDANPPPKLLAVSILTHHDNKSLQDLGFSTPLLQLVQQILEPAKRTGIEGCIASAHEAASLKKDLGKDFLVITPGIRPKDSDSHEQRRAMSPQEAIKAGADYLVVGRPITQSRDRKTAAKALRDEIEQALLSTSTL